MIRFVDLSRIVTDVIWDNMSMSLNKKIENVQLEASRIVTGGTRLVSLNNLYMETGWEKLKDRREKHKLVRFSQLPLSEITSPRCLCSETVEMSLLSM
jgi:hypothetical protein